MRPPSIALAGQDVARNRLTEAGSAEASLHPQVVLENLVKTKDRFMEDDLHERLGIV